MEIVPLHRMVGDRGLARHLALMLALDDYSADSDRKCGGHVHLDISMFPDKSEAVLQMHQRWSLVESLLYNEVFDYGYDTRATFGRGLYENTCHVKQLFDGQHLSDVQCRGGGRYSALNVTSYPTIEVRAANQMLGKKAVAYAYFLMRLLHDDIPLGSSVAPHRMMQKWLMSLPESILTELGITDELISMYVIARHQYTLDKHGPELPLVLATSKKNPHTSPLGTANTEVI